VILSFQDFFRGTEVSVVGGVPLASSDPTGRVEFDAVGGSSFDVQSISISLYGAVANEIPPPQDISGNMVAIAAPAPKLSTWTTMIVGFAGTGLGHRRRNTSRHKKPTTNRPRVAFLLGQGG
jgi:hypothetical protein